MTLHTHPYYKQSTAVSLLNISPQPNLYISHNTISLALPTLCNSLEIKRPKPLV